MLRSRRRGHDRRNRRRDASYPEHRDPDPGQPRGDLAEHIAVDHTLGLTRQRRTHARTTCRSARRARRPAGFRRSSTAAPTAARPTGRPAGHRRDDQECCPAPISSVRPGVRVDTADGHPGNGDREGDQSGNEERHIADQRPIDDPRCEAKQNAHDRSVYGRGHSAGT